jgi:hypothetical protein
MSLDTELVVAEKDAGEDKEKLNLFYIIEKYRKSLQNSIIKHYKKIGSKEEKLKRLRKKNYAEDVLKWGKLALKKSTVKKIH